MEFFQLLPVLPILFFIGMWLAVTFLLSYLSGWVSLKRHYLAAQPHIVARVRISAAQMGRFGSLGTMRNALTIGINPEGILLQLFILFRINSRDLFIPWRDITVTRGKSLFFDYIEFHFRREPSIPLRIYGKAGASIQTLAGVAWPRETPRDPARELVR
jgi:hypothetical protein